MVDKANILICDDEPRNILALEVLLQELQQNLVKAASGREALRHLNQSDFAVVVLDVRMPELDGFETAQLIRRRKKTRHTPIIFLTAHRDEAQLLKGYEAGAVDYLTKPIAPEVLLSKVRIFVELHQKNQEVRLLQERQHEQELEAARREVESARMRSELELARLIQRNLYPASPHDCPGFEMHGETRSAAETSGDYFDFLRLADGTLGVVVADVCGHGVGPALLMAATRAYLRALVQVQSDPAEILTLANRLLADDVQGGMFVTLLLARIDPSERTIVYASAGHPAGYVLDESGQVCSSLPSTGLPLGILSDTEFERSELQPLPPGGFLFAHTDGINEAMNAEGAMFGRARALTLVRRQRRLAPREIISSLISAVCQYTSPQEPLDDLTALVLKFPG